MLFLKVKDLPAFAFALWAIFTIEGSLEPKDTSPGPLTATDNILMEPTGPTASPTPTTLQPSYLPIDPNDLFIDREAEHHRSHTFIKPPPVTWIEVPPTETPTSKCYRHPYHEKTKAGGWYTTGPPHPSGMPSTWTWNPTSTPCYTD